MMLLTAMACQRAGDSPPRSTEDTGADVVDEAGRDLVTALAREDSTAAYASMCPEYREAHSEAAFARDAAANPYLAPLREVERGHLGIVRSERAELVLNGQHPRFGSVTVDMRLRFADGDWCVAAVSVSNIPVFVYGD